MSPTSSDRPGDLGCIVWLDPGETTGMAMYDTASGGFQSGQYSLDGIWHFLDDVCVAYTGRLAVGYEQYITTPGGVQVGDPKPSRTVIQYVHERADMGKFALLKPVPSSARTLGNKTFLRRLGWYTPGQKHANDAAMHLLAYLLRTRPVPKDIYRVLFPGYDPGDTITASNT